MSRPRRIGLSAFAVATLLLLYLPLAAVAALFTLALAGAASAQTYGQPVYLDSWGRPVGGSPLSEVETRAYVGTGRWADGYSDRSQVHVPAPYGRRYGYAQGPDRYGYGYDYAYTYDYGKPEALAKAS